MKDEERNVIYYCTYCKEPIYEGKEFVKDRNDNPYHPDCFITEFKEFDPYSEV